MAIVADTLGGKNDSKLRGFADPALANLPATTPNTGNGAGSNIGSGGNGRANSGPADGMNSANSQMNSGVDFGTVNFPGANRPVTKTNPDPNPDPNPGTTFSGSGNAGGGPSAELQPVADSLMSEANAAYTATNTNQNIQQPNPGQPTYKQTQYVDANGVMHDGYTINGRTVDANGNDIQGEFYVASPNGTYWKRNADGSSSQIDAATYNSIVASGMLNSAGQAELPPQPPAEMQQTGVGALPSTGQNATQDSAYGIDFEALQNGYTPPEAPNVTMSSDANSSVDISEIVELANQGYTAQQIQEMEDNYQRPEMPTEKASDYEGMDLTEQINDLYDKKYDTVVAQINNALQLGEMDIDHAVEKIPQIYDASLNDMSAQFELSKRNYNEYAAANGLTSGAKAQSVLAMNNVYNANVAALKQEQADKLAEYEYERTKLRTEAQGKITEALMSNETERAQAILAEYNRQDEQNFQAYLTDIDNAFKYYSTNMDAYLKEYQLGMEKWQYENDYAQKERQLESDSRYKTVSMLADIRQIEDAARNADNELAVQLYKIANDIQQFQATYGINVAQLELQAKTAREEADLAKEKFEEQKREFGENNRLAWADAEKEWEFKERAAQLDEQQFQEGVRQWNEKMELSWEDYKETVRHNLVTEDQDQQQIDYKTGKGNGGDGNKTYTPPVTPPVDLSDVPQGVVEIYQRALLNESSLQNEYYDLGMGERSEDVENTNNEYITRMVRDYAKNHASELVTDAILDDAEKNPSKYNLGYDSAYLEDHLEEVIAEKIVWDYLSQMESLITGA